MTAEESSALDLEQFVDMFDTAMNSTNPTVKKCFNNLLIVVALAHAEDDAPVYGPLRSLLNTVHDLSTRIVNIENRMMAKPQTGGPAGSPTTYYSIQPNTLTGTGSSYVNGYGIGTVTIPSTYNTTVIH